MTAPRFLLAAKKPFSRIRISKRFVIGAAAAVALIATFSLGVAVGDGGISFSQYSSTNGLPKSLNYASVNQVYQALRNNYDGKLTVSQLMDGMKNGLVNAAGDPHTNYFNPSQVQDFNNQLSGTLSGIGAQLGQDSGGHLIIVKPLSGSPAEKAGLKAQDQITKIDSTSTSGMSVDDAATKIRGTKGTKVTLAITRDGAQNLIVTITRDNFQVPSVDYKILDGNIGYIDILQFNSDTGDLTTKAAQYFEDQHVKGVILDMRDNPGGLLDQAVNVSSLWLPTDTEILQEKRGDQVIQTYRSNGNDILRNTPTAVLINENTASAAEITAGALHDNKAATLIGVKSYGKGSVQQVVDLPDGSEVKVTVARWYRPDGENIDKKGITPDQLVTLTSDQAKAGQDPQQDAALKYLQQ